MKRFLLFLFFLISFSAKSQYLIQWFDENRKLHNQIDLKLLDYSEEISPGKYKQLGKVQWTANEVNELPPDWIDSFHFNLKGKSYFTIKGTGQVYAWDRENLIVKRIDKTYYRGFNFISTQFTRKDTLYSFGGYGYWDINNKATFYDFNKGTWELINYKNDGPSHISIDFSGYDAKRDRFVAIEIDHGFIQDISSDQPVYEFNFSTRSWKILGRINKQIMLKLGVVPSNAYWLGDKFLFSNGPIPIILDPVKNKILSFTGSNKFFLGSNRQIKLIQDSLVAYNKSQISDSAVYSIQKEPLSYLNLNFEERGNMFVNEFWWSPFSRLEIFNFALVIFSVVVSFAFLRKRKLIQKIEITPLLSKVDHDFFRFFVKNGVNYGMTTNELNEILDCQKKSVENQKQYRNRFIHQLNLTTLDKYELNDVILRKPTDLDRRFLKYHLSKNGKKVLEILINNSLI